MGAAKNSSCTTTVCKKYVADGKQETPERGKESARYSSARTRNVARVDAKPNQPMLLRVKHCSLTMKKNQTEGMHFKITQQLANIFLKHALYRL